MTAINLYSPEQARDALDELVELLRDATESGASIGFLPPLSDEEAMAYWTGNIAQMERGTRLLLVAREDGRVVGSVQLEFATKPNATHRAEVQKLLVHRSYRNRGIGRALMAAMEEAARQAGRTLLVLDTIEGDVAEGLYRRMGYVCAGTIPQFARSTAGVLETTVIFYRLL
jgi:acetyltransferase